MVVSRRCRSFGLLVSDGGTNPPICGDTTRVQGIPGRATMIERGLKWRGHSLLKRRSLRTLSWAHKKTAAKTKGLHFYFPSVYTSLLSEVWVFSPNLLGFQNERCSVWAVLRRQTASPWHKWRTWLTDQREHQSSLLIFLPGLTNRKWQNRNKYTWFKYRKKIQERTLQSGPKMPQSEAPGVTLQARYQRPHDVDHVWQCRSAGAEPEQIMQARPGDVRKVSQTALNQRPLRWLPPDTRASGLGRWFNAGDNLRAQPLSRLGQGW